MCFCKLKKKDTYFFEVKCHEIFDDHKEIKLKWKYVENKTFKKVCEVKNIIRKTVKEKVNGKEQDVDYITSENEFLCAKDFGWDLKTHHFDFKQFLCHLMGICSYQEQHSDEQLHFWYVFYKNDEFVKQTNSKIYDELEAELNEVFGHFSKLFPNIKFGYCYNDEFTTLKSLTNKFTK